MPSAIVLHQSGAPENLQFEPVTVRDPLPNEVRLRHMAVGVNFHDIYVRSGLYQTLALPGTPGIEGVGFVVSVGAGVQNLKAGDRVAYIYTGYGAYAEERVLPADAVIRVPDGIDDHVIAASLLKGLTAHVLLRQVYAVKPGDWVLVHAAAGGVGTLLSQWATHMGAQVIGTVGSAHKVPLAERNGCAHIIQYRQEDFVTRVKDITGGAGVQVAYDAVGKDTFFGSLECLASCGHLANYGQASGPVPPFEVSTLFAKSNSVSRPSVFHHLRSDEKRQAAAVAFFEALKSRALKPDNITPFPLANAAQAHQAMESRSRHGSVILTI
ncbi:quinone oxidoreductase family protein [Pollutimonas harenae]|uniref:Quinone oxidoreductase n=1 Tax=Pollutimonas harenae TaxID=657015 RepID=A0A853H487_9BURK|nr:quinone oxidoreductase [Pollutimonas harenae]NYT86840.1 quinone oxidoreductase [Pollutimonas harenae]TEA71483.1 quinone oxidoreductase [Pollutimonas harenae]